MADRRVTVKTMRGRVGVKFWVYIVLHGFLSGIGQAHIDNPVARTMGRETHNGRALALA